MNMNSVAKMNGKEMITIWFLSFWHCSLIILKLNSGYISSINMYHFTCPIIHYI